MSADHTCPVTWAADNGLLAGSPIDASWCLSAQRETVMNLAQPDAQSPDLLLWQQGPLSAYYAPWDWVNTSAKVMLVGITPGRHQATEALREARRCLLGGSSNEEALRCADAVGSFSGPMRSNLVSMLDGIGLAEALAIETTAVLFGTHHHLAAHVSAIDYPVFVNGGNYGGARPPLVGHPVLRSLVRAGFGARVTMAPNALVVPLGKAAQEAAGLLISEGILDPRRGLEGFPHPSGGNGWRKRQYTERREELRAAVRGWANATVPTPSMNNTPALSPRSPAGNATAPPGHTGRKPTVPTGEVQMGVVINVTGGNVRNSHIYLRGHEHFFPQDALGAPNAKDGLGTLLTLYFEGLADPVCTDIARDKLIFRNRQAVARWFALHGLGEGDRVVIDRLSEYEFRIRPLR